MEQNKTKDKTAFELAECVKQFDTDSRPQLLRNLNPWHQKSE